MVLRYELFKKGISPQVANEVISKVYAQISEEELIGKVVKKEIGQIKITDEIRRRLCQKLLRLGFSSETIEKVTESRH